MSVVGSVAEIWRYPVKSMAGERIEIPLVIGGREVRSGTTAQAVMPHDHRHVLADWHKVWPSETFPAEAISDTVSAISN